MIHKARKRFGQNFLIDNRIIDRIIATISPKRNDNLLEIGPGQGAITIPLLNYVNQLNVIEIDLNLISILESLEYSHLIIYQGDVLKFDLNILPMPIRIIGNLPYNISSSILFHLIENLDKIQDITVMLQKEVVERMGANSGSKVYGRLSVMMQTFFNINMIFTVPPESFNPVPRVDSAIVYLKPLAQPKTKNIKVFEKVVKLAFSQRRKMLRNSLKYVLTQKQTDIDLSRRAEMLTVDDFITLTQDYEKQH
ncbi:16S rRNA (adenine(1518)-N(6)/adenine(1519)-N(6))-dimethyltransferase RsmA [Candidatus Vesicomyidisocius calyptogenae]|uniref:16S rRNA (adenine(1518)-N(6)/adenine(1519)-N(6))- dimethyltransferase RsmA n=1 Tax=Vesicomyosocius okutanii subsp. Calyptogena okutanii (strain HA) TaxID=412965 RepID=UPI0002F2D26A|nr:16S rRNA (adenine(1518)-N(6)/adenine(1519)-N(6))-dimethyltransferase RsmA [Candidatus Vesicomyosocius okutanii]